MQAQARPVAHILVDSLDGGAELGSPEWRLVRVSPRPLQAAPWVPDLRRCVSPFAAGPAGPSRRAQRSCPVAKGCCTEVHRPGPNPEIQGSEMDKTGERIRIEERSRMGRESEGGKLVCETAKG